MAEFVLYNKNFFRIKETVFDSSHLHNLLFSDQLTMLKSKLPFWDDHVKLWKLHFQLFKIKEPDFLANEEKGLKRQIERALVKNKSFKSALIRISFFCSSESPDYLIEIFPQQESPYTFNLDGYHLELFRQIQKSDSQLSSLKIGSEAIWKIAKASMNGSGKLPLIINLNHCILETPEANVFLIKNRQVYTPAPTTGCYINAAKRKVNQVCEKLGIRFDEIDELYEEDLLEADEIFIANDLHGVQYIRAFEMKRFFRRYSQQIAEEFNRSLIH